MTDQNRQLGSSQKDTGFVQIDRAALRDWQALIRKSSTAAELLMVLVRYMDGRNAVVISRKTMAGMLEVSERSVYRYLKMLEERQYVELVRVGNLHAVVVNARVAWTRARGARHEMAVFDARIVASRDEQDSKPDDKPLRRVPMLMSGEEPILPEPERGDQMGIDGIEPERGDLEQGRELPNDSDDREAMEQRGQQRLFNEGDAKND